MHYLIKDLNQDEKPREKLVKIGQENLTDVEILAILLRIGGKEQSVIELARQVMGQYNTLQNFALTDYAQLTKLKNINAAKATTLLAAIELGKRIHNFNNEQKDIAINSPKDIYVLLKNQLSFKSKENLYLISLNSRNKLIAKDLLSVGTINETLISPREIFRQALIRNAVSIALAHNHPSNDCTPSQEDIDITLKIRDTAQAFGLNFIDHIIFSNHSFSSLKSLGFLKERR